MVSRLLVTIALATGVAAAPARADVIGIPHDQAARALGGSTTGRPASGAPGSPAVATGQPQAAGAGLVTLTASINPNGHRTTYRFDYGTTTEYGSRTPLAVLGGDRATDHALATVAGLAPAATYHFRVVATNARGTTTGQDLSFVTAAATYTNPVFTSAFPDPMAALTGSDYYAYATGYLFPILHSTDLVNWSSAGTAFTPATAPAWITGNWWAPSVLVMPVTAGRGCPGFDLPVGAPCFFMYYTGKGSYADGRNCIGVATSYRPDGGFVDHGILSLAGGEEVGCGDSLGHSNIDPAPFVDAGGQAFLLYQTKRTPTNGIAATISAVRLATDLIHAVGSRQPLITGTQTWEQSGPDKIVEGPWLHRHGSRYYLFYSGGDFTADYAMGYAVGSSPLGPFTKYRRNPILRGNSAVIGPGGGSVVRGPLTGADQMVYHARSAPGADRTLRVDRLVWNDSVRPATVYVHGPTTTPQPLP